MSMLTYPPATTALILIDVLNDFLAPDGKLHGAIGPMLEKTGVVHQLVRLQAGARQAGLQIFYAPHGQDEHSFDGVQHIHPRLQGGIDGKVFWKGSYGADFLPALRPLPGETVITQHHMFDSFMGTDLLQQLQAQGIDYVVLAGMTAQTCVEGTGRHALEAGYHVTFIHDAVAEFTEAAQRAAIDVSYPTFGHESLTVDGFLARIAAASA